MSLAIIYCRANMGIQAPLVTIETHITNKVPRFSLVGLPETTVKESKDRVISAILNSDFQFPRGRITINLAPADLPKEGGRFDLPIALGLLAASGQIAVQSIEAYEFVGELALNGALRGIPGVLPFALATHRADRALILPPDNAFEASLINDLPILPAKNLSDVCAHLNGHQVIKNYVPQISQPTHVFALDIEDVKGQDNAKRALEIAAAGGHSLMMVGPPGAGKTMLASRLPSLLPPLRNEESLEVAAIQSLANKPLNASTLHQRPFRAPHHTASAVSLVGGGRNPKPGEISLAHHGVLFLDELPEFDRRVLEVLREPLESGEVTISRALRQAEFPAAFQLIAAMNPCPCGYATDPKKNCQCTHEQISRYRHKLSGPLLDRIDMHIEVPSLPTGVLLQPSKHPQTTSQEIRERVILAREKQVARAGKINAKLENKALMDACQLDQKANNLLETAMEKLQLSARAYHRVLRLARTIADLANHNEVKAHHLSEALTYRCLDRDSRQQTFIGASCIQ